MTGITSFAQNFEDVLLWRALQHITNGTYVDIGAQHPVIDSVSKAFYDRGWRGIGVEPTAFYADLLRQDRPEDETLQAVVAEAKGQILFYEVPDTGLSTASAEIAEHHRQNGFEVIERQLPSITLDDVFDRVPTPEVHWLKIDVEGYERQVLSGWQHSPHRPWIVVVESTYPNSQRETHSEWEALVLAKGYRLTFADGLNRYYLSDAKEPLSSGFRYCPNIFDQFQLTEKSWAVNEICYRHAQEVSQLKSEIARLQARTGGPEQPSTHPVQVQCTQADISALSAQMNGVELQMIESRAEMDRKMEHLTQFETDVAQHLLALGRDSQKWREEIRGVLDLSVSAVAAEIEALQSRIEELARAQTGGPRRPRSKAAAHSGDPGDNAAGESASDVQSANAPSRRTRPQK